MRVILLRERGAAEAVLRGDRSRLQRRRLVKQWLRLIWLALIEIAFADPDKRRHIVRLQLQRAVEGRDRRRRVPFELVEMTEVVGPAWIPRVERLGVE